MQVTVKYFGIASAQAGKREEAFTLSAGTNLANIKNLLNTQYRIGSETVVFFNLNGKGVAVSDMESCQLSDGDVIMIIPQISGG